MLVANWLLHRVNLLLDRIAARIGEAFYETYKDDYHR